MNFGETSSRPNTLLLASLQDMDLEQITMNPGQLLMMTGKPGAKVYILIKGSVSVFIEEKEIRFIDKPGEIFGEMSVILSRNQTATISVNVPSTFFVIDDLMTFLRLNPDIALHLIRLLAGRLLVMNQHLSEQLQEDNPWWKIW